MHNLFYRRHYVWLAQWARAALDKGTLTEDGVIHLMNELQHDNAQFKPEAFWRELNTTVSSS